MGSRHESSRCIARNPARSLAIGGNALAFCSVASAPNVADREGGRRPGNRPDFQNLIRLGQGLDAVHLWGGYPVEPADIHASIRHLDALFDMLTLSDKPIHAYSLGRERNQDALEMTRIARGIDDATLEAEPSLFTIINSSSPLRLDGPMLEGIIQMARRNQVTVLTPFTLAGAMAPVTMAGAVAQQNAEALAGLVFTQMVRAGRALRLWRVHVQRGHEIRCAGLRHARIHEGLPPWRPACPALRAALPLVQRQRGQHRRCPGGL